ncbi:phenylalanine--tRNA ligase subunit beta [Bacteroidia bacterium]|jgi:phenylalanyl-tRNA synthetase beta chain|nr:phenylalanine--tRNA ligase subunit beta [Bacteroidia bacterium]
MKISYNWLKQLINIDLSLEEVCEKLTMSGLEVEHIIETESIKGGLKGLIVGEVISKKKHPNADSLNLTTVDVGKGDLLSIVCGAKNVEVGQKVVVAPIGTTIHTTTDSFKIKKAKIRGEVSEGMICAEDEIGLGSDHDGILVLDNHIKAGTPLTDLFEVDTDQQIEIAIIPNRGDAISHLGVARELQALTGIKYKKPTVEKIDARGSMRVDISIDNLQACPRYAGITISSVDVKDSPYWLKKLLKSIDLKPINNIVDVSNFIQHEIGQPLHVFDYDKIQDHKIIPRFAKSGEKLTTLDGEDRDLSENHFIIADSTQPLALAGVLGGLESGVTESTSTIFIESAYFDPAVVRKTAKSFGLNTDASYRFERGTDPEMVDFALTRAVNLILEIAGGEINSEIIDIYPEAIEPRQIEINFDQFNRFIGYEIPKEKSIEILKNLEIKILANNDINILLEVPRYRPDIERPVDIYEEILRVYGFDNIPIPEKVNYIPSNIDKNAPNKLRSKISNYLANIGFNEIMNNSLVPSRMYAEEEIKNAVHLLNPLSIDMDVMRMELTNSALESIAYNLNRKNTDLKFFEFGKTYIKKDENYIEREVLQLTFSGKRHPEHWSVKSQNLTHNELIAVAFRLGKKLNISESKMKKTVKLKTVSQNQLKFHGLKQDVITLSIDWDACLSMINSTIQLKEIPKYPIVRRDLSIVLQKETGYEDVVKVAKSTLQQKLTDVLLFDVYEGKPLEENQKSFSVAFFLYDSKKTMEDSEIDNLMQKLILSLEKKIDAIIRK